jgi:hypothetical protein
MNKSLDNKKETTYGREKERKSTDNHKRVTGQPENMMKQKDDTVNQELV